MRQRIKVHVGTLEDMSKRFVRAWRRLDEPGGKGRERRGAFPDPRGATS